MTRGPKRDNGLCLAKENHTPLFYGSRYEIQLYKTIMDQGSRFTKHYARCFTGVLETSQCFLRVIISAGARVEFKRLVRDELASSILIFLDTIHVFIYTCVYEVCYF
jgi:hypothetical protein